MSINDLYGRNTLVSFVGNMCRDCSYPLFYPSQLNAESGYDYPLFPNKLSQFFKQVKRRYMTNPKIFVMVNVFTRWIEHKPIGDWGFMLDGWEVCLHTIIPSLHCHNIFEALPPAWCSWHDCSIREWCDWFFSGCKHSKVDQESAPVYESHDFLGQTPISSNQMLFNIYILFHDDLYC